MHGRKNLFLVSYRNSIGGVFEDCTRKVLKQKNETQGKTIE